MLEPLYYTEESLKLLEPLYDMEASLKLLEPLYDMEASLKLLEPVLHGGVAEVAGAACTTWRRRLSCWSHCTKLEESLYYMWRSR